MTRQRLLLRFKNLLIKTGNEWKDIAEDKLEGKEVINRFTLPLIALSTLATFIGNLINNEGLDFESALKVGLANFLSAFIAVHLSILIINLLKPTFHLTPDKNKTSTFVGYTYGLYLVIEIATGLIPEFYLLRILILYTVYIIWEGVVPVFKVREEQRTGFAFICALVILLIPYLLDKLLFMLIPGNSI